jgi:integrase
MRAISARRWRLTLRGQIEQAAADHVGVHINPHLFRHFAALVWLHHHVGDYATVARFLGHKSENTTFQYYSGLETIAAAEHYAGEVVGLRSAHERGRLR